MKKLERRTQRAISEIIRKSSFSYFRLLLLPPFLLVNLLHLLFWSSFSHRLLIVVPPPPPNDPNTALSHPLHSTRMIYSCLPSAFATCLYCINRDHVEVDCDRRVSTLLNVLHSSVTPVIFIITIKFVTRLCRLSVGRVNLTPSSDHYEFLLVLHFKMK